MSSMWCVRIYTLYCIIYHSYIYYIVGDLSRGHDRLCPIRAGARRLPHSSGGRSVGSVPQGPGAGRSELQGGPWQVQALIVL